MSEDSWIEDDSDYDDPIDYIKDLLSDFRTASTADEIDDIVDELEGIMMSNDAMPGFTDCMIELINELEKRTDSLDFGVLCATYLSFKEIIRYDRTVIDRMNSLWPLELAIDQKQNVNEYMKRLRNMLLEAVKASIQRRFRNTSVNIAPKQTPSEWLRNQQELLEMDERDRKKKAKKKTEKKKEKKSNKKKEKKSDFAKKGQAAASAPKAPTERKRSKEKVRQEQPSESIQDIIAAAQRKLNPQQQAEAASISATGREDNSPFRLVREPLSATAAKAKKGERTVQYSFEILTFSTIEKLYKEVLVNELELRFPSLSLGVDVLPPDPRDSHHRPKVKISVTGPKKDADAAKQVGEWFARDPKETMRTIELKLGERVSINRLEIAPQQLCCVINLLKQKTESDTENNSWYKASFLLFENDSWDPVRKTREIENFLKSASYLHARQAIRTSNTLAPSGGSAEQQISPSTDEQNVLTSEGSPIPFGEAVYTRRLEIARRKEACQAIDDLKQLVRDLNPENEKYVLPWYRFLYQIEQEYALAILGQYQMRDVIFEPSPAYRDVLRLNIDRSLDPLTERRPSIQVDDVVEVHFRNRLVKGGGGTSVVKCKVFYLEPYQLTLLFEKHEDTEQVLEVSNAVASGQSHNALTVTFDPKPFIQQCETHMRGCSCTVAYRKLCTPPAVVLTQETPCDRPTATVVEEETTYDSDVEVWDEEAEDEVLNEPELAAGTRNVRFERGGRGRVAGGPEYRRDGIRRGGRPSHSDPHALGHDAHHISAASANNAYTPQNDDGITTDNLSFTGAQRKAFNTLLVPPEGLKSLYIAGPPGTGKSEVIAHAISRLLLTRPRCHILLCAPSHSAVDVVTLRVISLYQTERRKRGECIPEPEKIIRRLYPVSRHPRRTSPELLPYSNFPSPNKPFSEVAYEDRFFQPKHDEEETKTLFKGVRFVCCSISQTAAVVRSFHSAFDYLFIDEAAQAHLADALTTLDVVGSQAFVAFSGDDKQVAPHCVAPFIRPWISRSPIFYCSRYGRINTIHFFCVFPAVTRFMRYPELPIL